MCVHTKCFDHVNLNFLFNCLPKEEEIENYQKIEVISAIKN